MTKSATIEVEIPLENNEYDYVYVDVEIDLEYGNYGIGSYEYWGSRERDDQWGWEIGNITWDESKYSKEINELIEKDIDKNINIIYENAIRDIE